MQKIRASMNEEVIIILKINAEFLFISKNKICHKEWMKISKEEDWINITIL